MPQSSHGCLLCTGQASRTLHRTVSGDFDQSPFAPDFIEDEFLYTDNFEVSPPAFLSSTAALFRSRAAARLGPANGKGPSDHLGPQYIGGCDVVKAVLVSCNFRGKI
jgi:hypothetical protein